MIAPQLRSIAPQLRCGATTLDLSRPVVMGVLNVTPDSFSDGGCYVSDGGRYVAADAAVAHALRMVEEGAEIIDVGGESTRPGAAPVTIEEELRRVVPVVARLREASKVVISVDTSKPEVIRAAAAAGAGLINDVRALGEPGALEAAAASGCAVCVMHMKGDPRTMQQAPSYVDVVKEVKAFLEERVQACRTAGVSADRIAIDPGFGFGKTLEHNLELLRRLAELTAGEWPVLVGMSRKSMVGAVTGKAAGGRVYGSVALAVMAALQGARIIRVHDVAATVDAMKMVNAVVGR
ncbi:MAG TPA: dihydropteroate synthase [Steroidobacteraceae bacterium]|nr:dihydropteroate synthase [Steroidobacteraceae bacterium]